MMGIGIFCKPFLYKFFMWHRKWFKNKLTSVINCFIDSLGHPLVQNIQETVYPKPEELES